MKSDLRRLLEDEFQALGEQMGPMERQARDFWHHPDKPALSVWTARQFPISWPAPAEIPAGSPPERHLYGSLVSLIKPMLQMRRYGFESLPVIHAAPDFYTEPPVGEHQMAAMMGAEMMFPEGMPAEQRNGGNVWAKPLIDDASQIDALEQIDVAKSPIHPAILRSHEEFADIVGGTMPFLIFQGTPLDVAADIIGSEKFFELLAFDHDAASRLIDICYRKGEQVWQTEREVLGGRLSWYWYEWGIYAGSRFMSYISPQAIRQFIVPYQKTQFEDHGGTVHLDHSDPAILNDYLGLEGMHGCLVPLDWPMEPVVRAMKGKAILFIRFHMDDQSWEKGCRKIAQAAGQLRVIVDLTCNEEGDYQSRLAGGLEELRTIWDEAKVNPADETVGS